MLYSLHDLLLKMGAPEVREKGRMEWHYFDRQKNMLAGFAEIRLETGGERLTAEMRHLRENYTDDTGVTHPVYTESFYLYAERTARPGHFRVSKISLDGEDYSNPAKGIVELGLSVFHARALDISIRMMEQVFNKQDILDVAQQHLPDRLPVSRPLLPARAESPRPGFSRGQSISRPGLLAAAKGKQDDYGVVLPFRPRNAAARANA